MKRDDQTKRILEISLKMGALFILIVLSFKIIEPMMLIGIWAIIIAIGAFPLHEKLTKLLKGRELVSAVVISIMLILILLLPIGFLATNTAKTLEGFASLLESEKMAIPLPSISLQEIPIVGEQIYEAWYMASTNMMEVIKYSLPHLKGLAPKILNFAKNMGISIFQTMISVGMAGVFLLYGKKAEIISTKVSKILLGDYISDFTSLATGTIRSVVQGIIGVGVVQGLAAGIALSLAKVPGTGVLTILTIFLCIVQLPPMLVLVPVAIYLFINGSMLVGILFSIWVMVITFGDTPLRAVLFGRGLEVPSMVIFIGTIGGVLNWGIVGLFVGAVVLSLSYKFVEVLVEDSNMSIENIKEVD